MLLFVKELKAYHTAKMKAVPIFKAFAGGKFAQILKSVRENIFSFYNNVFKDVYLQGF